MGKKFSHLIIVLACIINCVCSSGPVAPGIICNWSLRPIATAIHDDAEYIARIHHDLNGLFVGIYSNIELVANKSEAADSGMQDCKKLPKLILMVRDDGFEIGRKIRDRDYVDIGNVVKSFKEACGEIARILTDANISLLKREFIVLKTKSAPNLKESILGEADKFECILRGVRFIVSAESGIPVSAARHLGIQRLLDIAVTTELSRCNYIEVKRYYQVNGNVYLTYNEGELFKVIINILRNAREALFGSKGTVSIFAVVTPDKISIKISDTGPGMPEEKVAAFNRDSPVGSSKGTGHGRGLDIIRELVYKNNGTVSVDSKSGQGTTFTLDFPAHATVPSAAKIYGAENEDSKEIAQIEDVCNYQTYDSEESRSRKRSEYGELFPTPSIYSLPILEYIKQRWPDADICDLGSGNGKFCFFAARMGFNSVSGIEAREEAAVSGEFSAVNNQRRLSHINGISEINFIVNNFLDEKNTDLSKYDVLYFFYTLPKKYRTKEEFNAILRDRLINTATGMKDGAALIVLGGEGIISDDDELSCEFIKLRGQVTVALYTRHTRGKKTGRAGFKDGIQRQAHIVQAVSSSA